MNIIDRIIEIADANGWAVNVTNNGYDCCTFMFSKYSPAGQDFSFEVDMDDNNIQMLLDNTFEYYTDYDCSEEAYIWLDNTGHGTNGAPYDMKDVYEDMEACEQMVLDLYTALLETDWSEYDEEEDEETEEE